MAPLRPDPRNYTRTCSPERIEYGRELAFRPPGRGSSEDCAHKDFLLSVEWFYTGGVEISENYCIRIPRDDRVFPGMEFHICTEGGGNLHRADAIEHCEVNGQASTLIRYRI